MPSTPVFFSHQWRENGLLVSTCLLCSKVAASAKPEYLNIAERCHRCIAKPAKLPQQESKGKPLRILSFGRDSSLLESRAAVLASAGYEVTSVRALPDLVRELDMEHSDAIVLCHSLTENETHAALLLVKSAGRDTPVIHICTGSPDPIFEFVFRSGHPEELLMALASAVRGIRRSAA